MSAFSLVESSALTQAVTQAGATPAAPGAPSQYLTFRVKDELYGVDILDVQEIRSHEPPTRLATAAPCIDGVIQLRGAVVPIFNLPRHLGLPRAAGAGVVVVLSLDGGAIGWAVDAVCDVATVPPEQLKPAPALQGGLDTQHIVGLAQRGGAGDPLLTLVDARRLLAGAGIATPRPVATSRP